MRKAMCKIDGFTLVELMIAIAIIGILAAFTTPGIIKAIPDYKLKSAAKDLFSIMHFTKMSAIRNNNDRAIVFDVAQNQYFICSDSGADASWSTTADNAIEKIVILAGYGRSNIRFGHGSATVPIGGVFGDDITYNNNVLVFNTRGTCNAGYIYLQNSNNNSWGTGTLSSGMVRIRKWFSINGSWER